MDETDLNQKLVSFRERLTIDQFKLEIECINQPALYAEVGEAASEARTEAKRMKDRLEFVKAELSVKIRKDPETHGIVGKPTEAAIESAIVLQNEYREAINALSKANHIADSLSILQASVEQRKSMIRDLVSLFIHSYYSDQNQQDMTGDRTAAGKVNTEMIIKRRQEIAAERVETEEE